MSQINYARYKYIPDEIDEKTFLEKFVIRTEIFDDIFEDIKQSDYSITNQHYIIVAQRGQGKTSLLRKINIEIRNDKELSKFLLPVKFAEEQYQIRTLCRLWELIAENLQSNYYDEFETFLDDLEEHIEDDDYELRCFSYFEAVLKQKKKKLIILIDNIDELLGKLKDKEQRHLREILLTSSSFKIIGASTKMFEQQYDYSKPFYEFFKVIKLTGLDYDESIRFLRTIAKDDEKEQIENIIKNNPQKIETLRQLTGGVPRTLVMLYDIFIDDDSDAFEDLLKVLNDVTPLYKDRMDNLPPILQDIVHNIAMNWDGITTKELAKKTRLESKAVSSQLKQLEKYQIIEFESMGKNKIYKIQERFFNIWYLMRFGRKKDRNRVEWLVRFLLSWYSRKELDNKAKKFLNTLNDKELNESYIYFICEALSYSGIDIQIEHEMKQNTLKYLDKISSNYKNELSQSDIEILEKAITLYDKKDINAAIKLLVKSNKTSKEVLFSIAALYYEIQEYQKAEEYYLKAKDSGENLAIGALGTLYHDIEEYEKAEEYYLKAIDNGDNAYLSVLSWLYFQQAINIEDAVMIANKGYKYKKDFRSTYILIIALLWSENFSESYEKFIEFLKYDMIPGYKECVILYLNILISKEQYYKAKEFLEMPKYKLKDRFKPIWYALMSLMQDDFPNEIKKMGSELKQSVDEVLQEIEMLKY